jgi:hypothetical protein
MLAAETLQRLRDRPWFGCKVARLPDRGTLIGATDLQGNLADFEALQKIYQAEDADGNEPILLFCGDLVHGPSPDMNEPGGWLPDLGTPYVDHSAELLDAFVDFALEARCVSLIGNHEHAHIGGPVVSKFHRDEAAVLERRLGAKAAHARTLFSMLPLIAVAPCGAVFSHGAPRRTEATLDAFERLSYEGYSRYSIQSMFERGTVGALLWARAASPDRAREMLAATSLDGTPNAFVAYGHDVVREGYEKIGAEQICVSTSYGLHDRDKVYLRLDLGARYQSVDDLREGHEILRLYP